MSQLNCILSKQWITQKASVTAKSMVRTPRGRGRISLQTVFCIEYKQRDPDFSLLATMTSSTGDWGTKKESSSGRERAKGGRVVNVHQLARTARFRLLSSLRWPVEKLSGRLHTPSRRLRELPIATRKRAGRARPATLHVTPETGMHASLSDSQYRESNVCKGRPLLARASEQGSKWQREPPLHGSLA